MEKKPVNQLILMTDEHTRKVLGCYGDEIVKTPHIDGLAREGTLFENAYTNVPISVPARASFATGDLIKLKNLLSPNTFSNFSDAIKSRNKEGIKSEFTFIGVKESSVEKYEKIKDNLFATVKFVAEVISVKRDKENKIIEGNPDKIKFVSDNWKFTKNVNQKSPNWYLSEIIS